MASIAQTKTGPVINSKKGNNRTYYKNCIKQNKNDVFNNRAQTTMPVT